LRTNAKVHGQTFGDGLDRGHMVPNAAIGSQYGALAQMETFLMSNMCPQAADLNRGPWARLEKWITHLASERDHVFVFCGPIFGDSPSIIARGSDRKIQVPEGFYMILIDTDKEFSLDFSRKKLPKVRILAYVFPQSAGKGDDFKDRDKFGASVDEIEAATKLNFFPGAEQLAGEKWKPLEAEKVMDHWDL
jgi:endonuclease G